MNRVLQGLALLLLLFVLLLAAAPFTAAGTRLLLALLPSLAPLEVEYTSGRLGGELRLRRLQLTTQSVELHLTDVHTELTAGCLWQSRFCFKRFDLGSLTLELAAAQADGGAAGATRPGTAAELWVLPVNVAAPRIRIDALQVRWPGGSWLQQEASLGLQAQGSAIVLDQVLISDGVLTLEPGPEAATGQDAEPLLLPEIALPLRLEVNSLELQAPRLRVGGFEQRLQRLALGLQWQGSQLALARLAIDSAEWGSLDAAGELDMAGSWPLTLQLDARPADAALPASLQGREIHLQLQGQADALDVVASVAGEPKLALTGEANLLAPALPFAAALTLSGPESLALAQWPGWPPALADAHLVLPLVAQLEGTLQAQMLSLDAQLKDVGYPLLALNLAASHSDGSVLVQALRLNDVAGEGSLLAAGRLDYGDEWHGQATLESPGMALPALNEYVFGHLSGRLATRGTLASGHWQVALEEVAISGDINGLPATLSGDLALAADSHIGAGELLAEANGARLRLYGGGAGAAAVVELDIADLGRWQSGSRGSAQLRGEWRAEDALVALRGSVNDIHWQALRVDTGTLSGELALAANGVLDASLSLEEILLGEIFLGTVAADISGTRETPRLLLSSGGRFVGELLFAGRQEGANWIVQVSTDGVQTALGRLALEAPFNLHLGPGGNTLGAHCWWLPESTLCTSEWTLDPSGGGSVSLDGDLALFAALLPQQLELAGPLSASLRANWEPGRALRASAQVLSGEGTLTQFYPEGESATLGWELLSVNLEQGEAGLALDATLQREGARILALAARLPADRAAALEVNLELEQLQLAVLRPFLPELARLDGSLSGALRLQGTLAQPALWGQLRWSEGALEAHANPTELGNAAVTVTLLDDRAELAGSALLGGGELALSGEARLRPEFELSVNLRGEDNRLLYPPSSEAVISPDLQLRATPAGFFVGGEVWVSSGVLAYEQLPAGSVSLSADVVEVDYAGRPIAQDNPLNLDADVRLWIRDRFKVRGRDLDATVGGDLSLQQRSGQPPQVFGSLNIVGGEFRAYRQRLLVRQGRIAFSGPPENPELNLRAERDIAADNVRVGVLVTGTPEEPQITLYSQPTLSQTETLSYLLRGRGMDSGAGADGTAMALSVGTGLVNQSGIVEGLNSLPGLRNVEFGAEGSEDDTAATVSGYIGDRIYLSYGVGLYEPVNILTARLYLQARLWLEVVSRLASSIDLYYGFDID